MGISLLTRGQHPWGRSALPLYGYIPARAGPTFSRLIYHKTLEVYPCSRGANPWSSMSSSIHRGISLLTRGQQPVEKWDRFSRGYIPAYAGPTSPLGTLHVSAAVYPCLRGANYDGAGSVPLKDGISLLARGLLVAGTAPGVPRWIPARVWSTRLRGACRKKTGVDPCSRGAYNALELKAMPRLGVSLLARGLPVSRLAGCRRDGRISACAGIAQLLTLSLAEHRVYPC